MTLRPSHLVVPGYLLAAVGLTWPLVLHFGSLLPAVYGPADAMLQVFLLGWDWHALTTDPGALFQIPIFYPEPNTLAYMDHLIGEAVIAGPISEVFGLGAAYNTLVLVSFVGSGWALYRLARFYGVSRPGAFLAGFLFAFSPHRFTYLGMLNQLQTEFLPLGLFFTARFLARERFRDGVAAALTLTVQSYFGWYGTFHLVVGIGLLLLWDLGREPGRWRRLPWRQILPSAVLAALLILPGVIPYLRQRREMPEFARSLGDSALWSADLLDYLRLNRENLVARILPVLGHDHGLFPGFVTTVLAAIALRVRGAARPSGGEPAGLLRRLRARVAAFRRREATGLFTLIGVSGFLLSLGPILQVAGRWLWIPLPFALCWFVIPGFASMRAPVRFGILVALAAALLAGIGYDRLRRRVPHRRGRLLAGALVPAALLAVNLDIPFHPWPERSTMPPVYSWLAAQPGADPILEIPVPAAPPEESALHAARQMYLLYHGKPRLDGVSGFTSRRIDAFRLAIQSFPDPEAVRLAYREGARRVIVHYGDYAPGEGAALRQRVEATPELREEASFGTDVVYAIEPAP